MQLVKSRGTAGPRYGHQGEDCSYDTLAIKGKRKLMDADSFVDQEIGQGGNAQSPWQGQSSRTSSERVDLLYKGISSGWGS